MNNLMRMIILNFGRITIKFEPYALGLEMQTFSQLSNYIYIIVIKRNDALISFFIFYVLYIYFYLKNIIYVPLFLSVSQIFLN
jgi:hypothetical protein